MLEAQAASTMHSLWDDVQRSEEALNNGDPFALDQFIHAAGTMIETFRLAKSNFSRSRVRAVDELANSRVSFVS